MNGIACETCVHADLLLTEKPCATCKIGWSPMKDCHWAPNENTKELIAFGRRAGIEEALATYRSTSPQEDPEIYIEALLEAK